MTYCIVCKDGKCKVIHKILKTGIVNVNGKLLNASVCKPIK